MAPRILTFSAALILLAGCSGDAPTATGPSGEVDVIFYAEDTAAGVPFDHPCYAGVPFNDTLEALRTTFRSEGPGARIDFVSTEPVPCHVVERVNATFEVVPRYAEVAAAAFVQATGQQPEVGRDYTLSTAGGFRVITVTAADSAVVHYERHIPTTSAAAYGVEIVAIAQGEDIVRALRANVTGAVFNGLALNGPDANVTVIGNEGDSLLLARAFGTLLYAEHPLTLHATFLGLGRAGPAVMPGAMDRPPSWGSSPDFT